MAAPKIHLPGAEGSGLVRIIRSDNRTDYKSVLDDTILLRVH